MGLPIEMLYPTFEAFRGKGIVPNIFLPENYNKLVENFYNDNGKELVDTYAHNLEELANSIIQGREIQLVWDDELGLKHIKIGADGGLDLNVDTPIPKYQEHNLGTETGIIAGLIATKYISELLKSE